MLTTFVLILFFLLLGGVLGNLAALFVGSVLAIGRSLLYSRWHLAVCAFMVGALVCGVVIPLVLWLAHFLAARFETDMAGWMAAGVVPGFLTGWLWLALGWWCVADKNHPMCIDDPDEEPAFSDSIEEV